MIPTDGNVAERQAVVSAPPSSDCAPDGDEADRKQNQKTMKQIFAMVAAIPAIEKGFISRAAQNASGAHLR